MLWMLKHNSLERRFFNTVFEIEVDNYETFPWCVLNKVARNKHKVMDNNNKFEVSHFLNLIKLLGHNFS